MSHHKKRSNARCEAAAVTLPGQASAKPLPGLLPLGAMMLAGMAPLAGSAIAQEAARELPVVSVQADADKPDGLRATATRVGKVLQDPHDVPQAVTTLTSTLMEEQQVGCLREALRNVSGLSFNAAEGGRSGDNMNLRGFYTFGDMYLDGIRDTAQYNRETFNLEQIDVLRGAGAMLFGRGQAGGVINQVSKTPLRIEQYKLTGSVGTDGYREVTADLNKPINENTRPAHQRHAARRRQLARQPGHRQPKPEIHRQGLAFSLGLNLHTNNQFWLNHYHAADQRQPRLRHLLRHRHRAARAAALPAEHLLGHRPHLRQERHAASPRWSTNTASRPTASCARNCAIADYERSYWAQHAQPDQAPMRRRPLSGRHSTAARRASPTTKPSPCSPTTTPSSRALGMKHEVLAGVEYLKEDSYRNGAAQPRRHHRRQPAVLPALSRGHDRHADQLHQRLLRASMPRTRSSSFRTGRPRWACAATRWTPSTAAPPRPS